MPAGMSYGPRKIYDLSNTGAALAKGPNKRRQLTTNPNIGQGTWPNPDAALQVDFTTKTGYSKLTGIGTDISVFTFSRSTTAYYFGPDGVLTQAKINEPRYYYYDPFINTAPTTNLLCPSHGYLAKTQQAKCSITDNTAETTDPLGTYLASKMVEDGTAGSHTLDLQNTFGINGNIQLLPGVQYTFSFYVKRLSVGSARNPSFRILVYDPSGTIVVTTTAFNLDTLVPPTNGTITSLSNSWYRCTYTFTTSAAAVGTAYNTNLTIYLTQTGGSTSYTGDSTSGLYLFGLQIETGASATTYSPNIGVLPSRATPIIPTPNQGILLEAESSDANSVLYCRDLTNGVWVGANISRTLTGNTGIDNTSNSATKITANAASAVISQTLTRSADTTFPTLSMYIKPVNLTGRVFISLDTTKAGSWQEFPASAINANPTYWTRLSHTVYNIPANPSIGIMLENSGDSIIVDAVQISDNPNKMPVFTTNVSVSTGNDQLYVAAESLINPLEGTLYAVASSVAPYTAQNYQALLSLQEQGGYGGGGLGSTRFLLGVSCYPNIKSNTGWGCMAADTYNNRPTTATGRFLANTKNVKVIATYSVHDNTSLLPNVAPSTVNTQTGYLSPLKYIAIAYGQTTPVYGPISSVMYIPEALNLEQLKAL